MKKLTIALLLSLSTSAFAQKNELTFSSGYTLYKVYNSFAKKKGYKSGLYGDGYQLSLQYMRNIKWLQIGAGVQCGKLSGETREAYNGFETVAIANPYATLNIMANVRLQMRKWTFYAGPCAGYTIGGAVIDYHTGAPSDRWRDMPRGTLDGFYKGGQLGAVYQLLSNLGISANASAQFTNLNTEKPTWINGYPWQPPFLDRLNKYNFSVGAHYKF